MQRARLSLLLLALVVTVSTQAQETKRAAADQLKRGADRYLKGDLEGALAAYDRALTVEPNAADIYVKRGNVRHAKGDLNGALADFDQALTLDPAVVRNDRNVAEAYSRRGYLRARRLERLGPTGTRSGQPFVAILLASRGCGRARGWPLACISSAVSNPIPINLESRP